MKRKATLKRKSLRAKRGGKRAVKALREHRAPIKTQQSDFVDSLIAANAQALGLTIDPAWRGGVKFNLELILRLGALVDGFPLADEIDPGPIFHA